MEPSPLDSLTASSFVKRLGEHLDYNINIMDRHGVIIASRDQSRVGSYHDAAQRLVATGAASEIVEASSSLPAGVRPGVNLPIVWKGETIGVVGVTGQPQEVGPLAWAVKTSVESMIELESWKDRALRRQDRKNTLIGYLLHEEGSSPAVAEALALKLGYSPKLARAPLVLVPAQGLDANEALRAIKANSLHTGEDISWAAPEGFVLVFKSLALGAEGIFGAYESQLRAYLEASRRVLGGAEALPTAYAGAFQMDLGRYGMAYRQCLWLRERFPAPTEGLVFLYDHLFDFLVSRIPRSELVGALDAGAALIAPGEAKNLGSWIDALAESGLNGKEAAARLGVHRNTFSSRLDRLAVLLGRDPRKDIHSLELFTILARYLEGRR